MGREGSRAQRALDDERRERLKIDDRLKKVEARVPEDEEAKGGK